MRMKLEKQKDMVLSLLQEILVIVCKPLIDQIDVTTKIAKMLVNT